jgi:hypothetical protein
MDPQLKKEIIELLKQELKIEVEVEYYASNVHNVITTTIIGDEVISKETKQCEIGQMPSWQ